MAEWNQDFDYFGKGLEGYVQYMQTFNEVNKKDESSYAEPEPADVGSAIPPRPAAKKTAAPPPAPSPEALARAEKARAAQKKKDRIETLEAVLGLLGLWLLMVFLFHDI